MRCPACATPLARLDRYGIAVRRCAGCRGVWLGAADLAVLADCLVLAPFLREPRGGGPACRACLEHEDEERRARQAVLRDLFAPSGPAGREES